MYTKSYMVENVKAIFLVIYRKLSSKILKWGGPVAVAENFKKENGYKGVLHSVRINTFHGLEFGA